VRGVELTIVLLLGD